MAVYAAAAAVLAGVESRQGSLKGLVYSSSFQVEGFEVWAREGAPAGGKSGPAPSSPGSFRPRTECEAAVRAGVRDATLLRCAGRRDRQRRPPPRREEAAAAPGQGDGGVGRAGRAPPNPVLARLPSTV